MADDRRIVERIGRLLTGGAVPNVDALKLLEQRETALVFVVEGFDVAWTDHHDLAGTSLFDDGRAVLVGLVPPDWSLAIDINADWQLARAAIDLTLEDLEGRLGPLFGLADGSETPLYLSIEPNDDLSLRTELHDRHVGTEYIGPTGERDYYPLNPAAPRPQQHVGEDSLTVQAAVPIAERPIILDGRRCALYRMWRDHVTYPDRTTGFSSWRPFSEADRRWWGTIRRTKHVIDGRAWSINADGPESWLYRSLGPLASSEWVQVQPLPTLVGDSETDATVRLSNELVDGTVVDYGTANSTFTGDLTPLDVRDFITALIETASLDDPGPGAFVDLYGQQVRMNLDRSIQIRIEEAGAVVNTRRAILEIDAHEKVWLALGYDYLQTNLDEEEYADFARLSDGVLRGRFTTRGGQDPPLEDWDNGGLPRVFRPLYPTGATMLESDAAVRPILCTLGFDQVAHSGQLDRPVASDPDLATAPIPVGDTDADTQGLWVFTGKRRYDGAEEAFDEYQVARCSWTAGSGLGLVGGDPPRIRITKWEDPQAFGFPRPPLSTPWRVLVNDAENGLRARPLLRLGYGHPDQDGEDAHVLLQRLFYTTGTSTGWNGYAAENPSLPATSNEPSGAPARLDAEIPTLGFAIDQGSIAPPAVWEILMDPLEEGLRKAGISFFPGEQSENILRSVMAPRGWALGLAGGRYTPFAYDQLVAPTDAMVLSFATKRTDDKLELHRSKQTVRITSPKDSYRIKYNSDPIGGSTRFESEVLDPSPGARYRPTREDRGKQAGGRKQSATYSEIIAPYQRKISGWMVRATDLAKWADAGHFMLHGYPLMPAEADEAWPGTRVVVTDPIALDPVSGTWGIVGAQGIILRTNNAKGGRSTTADILVDARTLQQIRYHAPSARGRGYDSSTRRLYVDDDWLATGLGGLDCNGFVEPAWSVVGGAARIQVHQYDGAAWTVTGTGIVRDVDATAGSCSIRLVDAFSGTYRRDDEAIITLRPYTDQDGAWVLALFAPISDQDGTWSTGTVVPWAG